MFVKDHYFRFFSEFFFMIFGILMPLSAIFQLYHGDQFQWWNKPEFLERTTDHGQATGKLYHLRLRPLFQAFVCDEKNEL